MNRRSFSKTLFAGLAVASSQPVFSEKPTFFIQKSRPKITKPRRLEGGMTVALVAPASPVNEEKLVKAMANMAALGLNVRPSEHLMARNGYLAGSDAERLADFHAAFSDKKVDAVWCIRGGYGCSRLLGGVDFAFR